MRVHRSGIGACLAAVSAVLMTLGGAGGASASGATLRVQVPTSSVAPGATFDVRIVQNAPVPTSGAQISLIFDPAVLQIASVTRAAPYAGADVFLGADRIADANGVGRLSTVAAAFLPPKSVPAGDQDFLVVTFKAMACGRSELDLPVGAADAALLDGTSTGYGKPLTVATTSGVVSTCGSTTSVDAALASGSTSNGDPPLLPIVLIGLALAAIAGAGLWSVRSRA